MWCDFPNAFETSQPQPLLIFGFIYGRSFNSNPQFELLLRVSRTEAYMVIELLKQLKLKFEDDKLAGTKAETNALNSYDLAKESRDNAITAASESKDKKNKDLRLGKLSSGFGEW